MSDCDIPWLYQYMSKVMIVAMKAQVTNELKWKLGSLPNFSGITPETRAADWQRDAAKYKNHVSNEI